MRKHLLCTTILFICMSCAYISAQNPISIDHFDLDKYDVLDTADYQVLYELKYVDNMEKQNKIHTNTLALLIGKRYSKFFNDQYIFYKRPKNIEPDTEHMFDGGGLAATEVYKNKKNQSLHITFKLISDKNVYQYEEPQMMTSWRIENETREILGYKCSSATIDFRGRTYKAWFTSDIPISEGPWKFSGLPGLILEVSDSNNYFSFKCTSIEQLKRIQPIVKYKSKYVNIDRKKLEKQIKFVNENHVAYENSLGIEVKYVDDNGNFIDPPKKKISYNPIELE